MSKKIIISSCVSLFLENRDKIAVPNEDGKIDIKVKLQNPKELLRIDQFILMEKIRDIGNPKLRAIWISMLINACNEALQDNKREADITLLFEISFDFKKEDEEKRISNKDTEKLSKEEIWDFIFNKTDLFEILSKDENEIKVCLKET